MSREATERLTARIYREKLEKTGRLPDGKETREMERKAVKIAEEVESKGRRYSR